MRVAIVGLGAIARKAYLPLLGTRPGLELVLCTRDLAALTELAAQYRVGTVTRDAAELPDLGVEAAFVHSATESHAALAGALLRAGVPVYLDKPIAYDEAAARELVELAERAGALLMVGFNRRFAPMVRRVKDAGGARLVVLQKNRVALPDAARRLVFDDFIHVADTLRYLAPGEPRLAYASALRRAGRVHHLVVQLEADGFHGVGIMNRDSGAAEEVLEVMSPGAKHVVRDLDTLTEMAGGEERRSRFGDWEDVLHRRGFPAIVDHFLACVQGRETPLQSARDALATHALCERIVGQIDETAT